MSFHVGSNRLLWVCIVGAGLTVAQADSYVVISDRLLVFIRQIWGETAAERVLGWDRLMAASLGAGTTDDQKIRGANHYFNQVRWVSDFEHWGAEDYWATPIETLASNSGDCEDYSIGKYFTLLYENMEPEKLRITYVKSLTYNQAHMVLTYYPTLGAEPLILDNINGEILPASDRPDLVPVYSFNGQSIWVAQARGRKLNADSQHSLQHWREVNERLLKQLNQ